MERMRLNVHGGANDVVTQSNWNEGWDMINSLSRAVDGLLADGSTIDGKISVPVACRSDVENINQKFPGLVEVDSNLQQFEDKNVMKILGNNNVLTVAKMNDITDIASMFRDNTEITSFNELADTSVTQIKRGAFYGCKNLISADFSKITYLDASTGQNVYDNAFNGCGIKILDFPNVTETQYGHNFFYGSLAEAISLPKLASFRDGERSWKIFTNCINLKAIFLNAFSSSFHVTMFGGSPNIALMDFGEDFANTSSTLESVPLKTWFVMRKQSAPSCTLGGTGIYCRRESISAYTSAYPTKTIQPIGGTEWCRAFGIEHRAEYDTLSYDALPTQVKFADYLYYGVSVPSL